MKDGNWLAREWAAKLGAAVSAMTGSAADAHLTEASVPRPATEGDLIWQQPIDAGSDTALWVVIGADVWRQIGQQVLTSAGIEEADEVETRGTFIEILQQSLSQLTQPLGARLGKEVVLRGGDAQPEAPDGLAWSEILVSLGDAPLGPVWFSPSPSLISRLEPDSEQPATQLVANPAPRQSRTLDLLMEVDLPVGVSFGRTQMRLKDALKLTTGSIVELNRNITEPVEVVVNNCVIARGEVVVVEGNYGVRIRQIVSREERLRTLF